MIYLDSSGLVKLLIAEAETVALHSWIEQQDNFITSSELAWTEVLRAVRRLNPDVLETARSFLAGVDLVPITRRTIEAAADFADPQLRSLDAIHLASALSIAGVSAFVAYDNRLSAAAASLGLSCVTPREAN